MNNLINRIDDSMDDCLSEDCDQCDLLRDVREQIDGLSSENGVKSTLLDNAINMLNEIATTETDKRDVGGFIMYCGEELQPFMDIEITQSDSASTLQEKTDG